MPGPRQPCTCPRCNGALVARRTLRRHASRVPPASIRVPSFSAWSQCLARTITRQPSSPSGSTTYAPHAAAILFSGPESRFSLASASNLGVSTNLQGQHTDTCDRALKKSSLSSSDNSPPTAHTPIQGMLTLQVDFPIVRWDVVAPSPLPDDANPSYHFLCRRSQCATQPNGCCCRCCNNSKFNQPDT